MKSRKIEKTVFITEDGKEFDDEIQAKKHEEITSLIQRIGLLTPPEIEQLWSAYSFGGVNLKPKESPSQGLTTEQQKDVTQLKKKLTEIIVRNTNMQASPQAILGNLIMEIQDLIR